MGNIADSVIPITVGYSDGNGVVVGDLFITAGHVVNKEESLQINIGGDFYSLAPKDALLCVEENSSDNGLFNDCAVYKLSKHYNNLNIEDSIPAIGSVLLSRSCKHYVEKRQTDSIGVFGTQYEEKYKFHTSQATVLEVLGNFIICDMDELLEEGRSGSPLFCGNKVVGILHGGIEGKTCVFQSMHSILQLLQNVTIP